MSAPARRSTGGSVAVIVAITLTVLIGFSALGSEVVFALFKQRQMQATASAAAFAGAVALTTGYPAAPATEAQAVAATAGFVSGTAGTTVTVNIPPLSGAFAGKATAVEVIVTQPQTLPLSSMFRSGPWNITVRAVATQGNNAGDCLLQLNSAGNPGLWVTGGASINASSCGVAVNGTGVNALQVDDGASLSAASVTVVGLVNSTNGTITSTKAVQTSQSAVANPYAGVQVPTYSGCTSSQVNWGGTYTLGPGTYCGGMSFSYGTMTLSPGVYIMNGGSFSVGGGTTVNGTGVTIVLTGSGTNYATMSIQNGTTINLSAPTTGAMAGLVFFQDPNAATSGVDLIQGGGKLNVTGALYFPSQTVEYSNGASTTTSSCTQLVAATIVFLGGATFNSQCAGTGVSTIGASPTQLVE